MKLLRVTTVILFPPLLFLLVILSFAFNLSFYQKQYDRIEVMQSIGRTDAVLQAAAVYDYLSGRKDQLIGAYTPREQLHLADVRNIIFYIKLITLVLAVLFIAASLWLYFKSGIIGLIKALLWSNIVSLIIFLVLIVLFTLNFNWLFLVFHQVMFRNDFWQLDPNTEMLINLFPPQFFVAMISRIFLVTIIINIVIICLALLAKQIKKNPAV
ncbi:MAG: DUF1461 domain-containing protein [Patescibacteria group bacterium]|jgi:integral membrane protein (TIGR01906 family)